MNIIQWILMLCSIIGFTTFLMVDWGKIPKKIIPRFKNKSFVFQHKYQIGNVIRFGFLPQDMLSNKHFEITDINDYFYGDDPLREFTLMDEQRNCCYLLIPITRNPQSISVSKKVNRLRLLFKESSYSYKNRNTINRSMLKEFIQHHPDMHHDLHQLSPPLFKTFNNLKCYDIPEECYQKKWPNLLLSFVKFIFKVIVYFLKEDYSEKKSHSLTPLLFSLTSYEDVDHHYAIKIHQYPSNRVEAFISYNYPISVIQDL